MRQTFNKFCKALPAVCFILALACAARAQSFSISVSNIEQLPGGKMRVEGSMSGSNLHPEGQLYVENSLTAYLEFKTGPDAMWSSVGEVWNLTHVAEGWFCGGKRVPDIDVHGQGISGGMIASFDLADGDEGKDFEFSSLVSIPTNATSARVTGEIFHLLNGPPWRWPARWMKRRTAASVSIIEWSTPGEDEDGDGSSGDEWTGGGADDTWQDAASSNAPQVVAFTLKSAAGFVNSTVAARRLRAEIEVADTDADLSKLVFIDESGVVQTKKISGDRISASFVFTPTGGRNALQVDVFDSQGHKSVRKKSLLLP